jgi:uncharacterized protein (DUF427 family)
MAERTTSIHRVDLASETIAETRRRVITLETSHPCTYYFPPDDIAPGVVIEVEGRRNCEWKGGTANFDSRSRSFSMIPPGRSASTRTPCGTATVNR